MVKTDIKHWDSLQWKEGAVTSHNNSSLSRNLKRVRILRQA